MSEDRPSRPMYVGITAAAAAVLILEIGLTRIFSYTIWYHFAYLTISVALLGFGASGSLLAAYPKLLERKGFLAGCALVAQLGSALALLVIGNVRLDPLSLASDPAQLARIFLYYVVVAAPFLAGGFLVAVPLRMYPKSVGRLYFWDLVGAGAACAATVPLIWALGTPLTTALASVLFAIAAIAYAPAVKRKQVGTAATVLAVGCLTLASVLGFPAAPTKNVSKFLETPGAEVAYSRWTPVNRVEVVSFDPPQQQGSYAEWGISGRYKGGSPGYWMIGNDGDSCAVMYNWDGKKESLEFLTHHVLRAPYMLLHEPEVLAIGLGGGADILNALNNNVKSIIGVELNPMTVHAVKDVFRDFNGDLLHQPQVTAVAAEGRSYLRSQGKKFDLVEINSVDTLSALSTGAYVLSESYLYTSDAVQDYLDHLKPGGIFAMAVGDYQKDGERPRHVIRLASIVRHALEARGVTDPAKHVIIVGTDTSLPFTHTLVKNEPFTERELHRIGRFAELEGFLFWHHPEQEVDRLSSRILRWDHKTLAKFTEESDLNFTPTTDESPFFFNFYKWRTLLDPNTYRELYYGRTLATGQVVLVVMLIQSIFFATLLIFIPLRRIPISGGGSAGQRLALMGYFAALGCGFILLEISLIQRFVLFLGYPTYSLTVVMFSLLVSTGVGSLLTERVTDIVGALPMRLVWLLIVSFAYMAVLPMIFQGMLGSPLAVRVIISAALLAPLGLVLGSFFPLGVRLAESINVQLVPWAWAVNGCATVVGTMIAVMAGMTWSFKVVWIAAMVIYVVGVMGLVLYERSRQAKA